MVRFIKLFMYVCFFFFTFVYFVPKVSLYYYVEQEFKKHKLIISEEKAEDVGFFLKINHANISYDMIESAKVKSIDAKVFILYNTLNVNNIVFSDLMASILPTKVESLNIRYNIFNPLYITAIADGEFGKAEMEFHIFNRNATLYLHSSELMQKRYQSTLKRLRKNDDGSYTYEKTF